MTTFDYAFAKSGQQAFNKYGENAIPVGSLEYTNAFLRLHSGRDVRALNIPPELNKPIYTGRKIWPSVSKKDLSVLAEHGQPLLMKPARTPKLFEASVLTPEAIRDIPENEPVFVSEMIPRGTIRAEWRVFARHGIMMGIHPYGLDDWKFPSPNLVERMLYDMREYPAIALDVGVLSSGNTVVMEAHNFLSIRYNKLRKFE